MTLEYVLLLAMGGLVFMSALMKAPKTGFYQGSTRLGSRIETQLATGNGFTPYQASGGDNGKVPWDKKD
jgi:hypothetical protein